MCFSLIYPEWGSLCYLDLTISFPILGKFSTIISSNIFSAPFFFSSSSEIPIIQMLVHLMFSQTSLRLSSILFILFSLFCSAVVISTILSSRSLIRSVVCSCLASCLAWGVQHWSLLVVEWSWVLALTWRSLGDLSPFDITWILEVSGGPMS